MTTLVIRGDKSLFVAHHPSAPLGPSHHTIHSLIEKLVGNFCRILPSRQKCCLIENVGEVGPSEAGSFPRQHGKVHTLGHGLAFGVNLQNLLPTLHVRRVHLNLAVKAAWA